MKSSGLIENLIELDEANEQFEEKIQKILP
jgi:hypothetical protein